jgi:4-amino-4-deoxy-L-arabinose transferase-like glycosyltransferase
VTVTEVRPPGASALPGPAHRRRGPFRPRWGPWAQLSVAALAAALYLSNLSVNGLGNPYYAAAVKSGSVSWKAFFFGSLDPGSFITVDKPPAAFWVQALSVRAFGYSSWSLLVPEALAGTVAAAVAYHLARRLVMRGSGVAAGRRGEVAGILAGLALAVTPVATVMFRFNDPDALLTLLLVLAAWAAWAAVERGSIRHLVVAGLLVGLAFDAKMLEAAVVVPGLALAWIVGAPIPWRRRLLGWLWSGIALVVSAGWWVAVVELWPTGDRPYIGSTSDNSLLSLIFGYNGFSRLFGSHGGGRGGGAISFGGGAGWTRLFSTTLGSQISWLLPLAAFGLVLGIVITVRDRRRLAGYLLWGGWGLAAFVVFSKSTGTFHSYYVVALAPPVAVLAAAGAVELWAVARERRLLSWLLPAAVVGSGLWAAMLLHRAPSYHPWLRVAIVAVAVVAALGLLIDPFVARSRRATLGRGWGLGRGLGIGAPALAVLALLAGPTAWSLSSVTHGNNGTNPTAGPSSASSTGFAVGHISRSARISFAEGAPGGGAPGGGAPGGGFFGSGGSSGSAGPGRAGSFGGAFSGFGGAASSSGPTAADRQFVAWLEANRDGAKYLVAVDGSMSADDLIIASGRPVMAMGGFSGGDPAPTLPQWENLVKDGQVRYVLVGGGGGFGGGFGGGGRGGSSTVGTVLAWVEAHGTVVPTSKWGGEVSGVLYEVTPATVSAAAK